MRDFLVVRGAGQSQSASRIHLLHALIRRISPVDVLPGWSSASFLAETGDEEALRFLSGHIGIPAEKLGSAIGRSRSPEQVQMPSSPRFGALSRTARRDFDVPMTRRRFRNAITAGDPVVRSLARDLRNPDRQIYYAREVEKVFGSPPGAWW